MIHSEKFNLIYCWFFHQHHHTPTIYSCLLYSFKHYVSYHQPPDSTHLKWRPAFECRIRVKQVHHVIHDNLHHSSSWAAEHVENWHKIVYFGAAWCCTHTSAKLQHCNHWIVFGHHQLDKPLVSITNIPYKISGCKWVSEGLSLDDWFLAQNWSWIDNTVHFWNPESDICKLWYHQWYDLALGQVYTNFMSQQGTKLFQCFNDFGLYCL